MWLLAQAKTARPANDQIFPSSNCHLNLASLPQPACTAFAAALVSLATAQRSGMLHQLELPWVSP